MKKDAATLPGVSGELYLALNNDQWQSLWKIKYVQGRSGIFPVKVKRRDVLLPETTVVDLTNDKGRVIGQRLMPVYAGDILRDALKQKLSTAGYSVKLVDKLPGNDASGVDIGRVATDLVQSSGQITTEVRCELKATIEIWKNGAKVGSHDYSSKLSGNDFSNGDKLLDHFLKNASQDISIQAVPDIVMDLSAQRK